MRFKVTKVLLLQTQKHTFSLIQYGTVNCKEQTGYCTRKIATVLRDVMHVEFKNVYLYSLKLNSVSNKEYTVITEAEAGFFPPPD
jgi:hypothetical protein